MSEQSLRDFLGFEWDDGDFQDQPRPPNAKRAKTRSPSPPSHSSIHDNILDGLDIDAFLSDFQQRSPVLGTVYTLKNCIKICIACRTV